MAEQVLVGGSAKVEHAAEGQCQIPQGPYRFVDRVGRLVCNVGTM
jgi:hypothetical protein